MKEAKIIFVVGGLFSGIGKGIVASSIAALLKTTSLKVAIQKIDPYLNIDSGLMNPYEHGEVFVTKDGLETDLDIGNYERFLEEKLTKDSSLTAGQIYWEILNNERKGKYQGKTVNIYDVSDLIKRKIFAFIHKTQCDILIVEFGGTIGDNDLFPFLVAAAQIKKILNSKTINNSKNVAFVFLTYIQHLININSFKTKSAQNSIISLRDSGIEPNFVILRSFKPFDYSVLQKISEKSYIDIKNIYSLSNQENIYKIPLVFYKSKLIKDILNFFNLKVTPKIIAWKKFNNKIDFLNTSLKKVKIAIISKYNNFKQSYASLWHALFASSLKCGIIFEYQEIDPSDLKNYDITQKKLKDFDGVLVPGGFGIRGVFEKMMAIQYARISKTPLLGICLGFQLTLIEFAKNVLKLPNSTSEEFINSKDKDKYSLIFQYFEAKSKKIFIGEKNTEIVPKTWIFDLYKKIHIKERYRNRFVFNKKYQNLFIKAGIVFSGFVKENTQFWTIFQLQEHPFFVGTQFHCELSSTPNKPHPLIDAFLDNCFKNKKKIF